MITLEQAIKIAEEERGKFEYSKVDSARDCGDRWFFTFAQDEGKLGSAPFFVFKLNGEIEVCSYSEEQLNFIENGNSVPLPYMNRGDSNDNL